MDGVTDDDNVLDQEVHQDGQSATNHRRSEEECQDSLQPCTESQLGTEEPTRHAPEASSDHMAAAALVQLQRQDQTSLQMGYERGGTRTNRPYYEDTDQYEYGGLAHGRSHEHLYTSQPAIHQAAPTSQSLNKSSDSTLRHVPRPEAGQQATLASLSEAFLGMQQRQDCITGALQDLSSLVRNIQHSMQAHTITADVGAIAALPTETTPLNEVQDAVTPSNRLCANGDKRTGYASYGYSNANEMQRLVAQKHEQRQSTVFTHRPYTATNTSDRRVDPVTITTYAAPQSSIPTQTDMAGTYWPSATQGECSDRYSRPSPMASFADMSACAPAPQSGVGITQQYVSLTNSQTHGNDLSNGTLWEKDAQSARLLPMPTVIDESATSSLTERGANVRQYSDSTRQPTKEGRHSYASQGEINALCAHPLTNFVDEGRTPDSQREISALSQDEGFQRQCLATSLFNRNFPLPDAQRESDMPLPKSTTLQYTHSARGNVDNHRVSRGLPEGETTVRIQCPYPEQNFPDRCLSEQTIPRQHQSSQQTYYGGSGKFQAAQEGIRSTLHHTDSTLRHKSQYEQNEPHNDSRQIRQSSYCRPAYGNRNLQSAVPEPKLPPFTGKEEWKVWFNRFEAVARRRNWCEEAKLDNLLPRLQGKAGDFVFSQLAQPILSNYNELVKELNSRFRVIETERTYAACFSQRSQRQDETAEEFAADLKRLYAKAYKFRDDRTRQEDLVRRFLDGLKDSEARFEIEFHKEPSNIDEAVRHAVNFVQTKRRNALDGYGGKKFKRYVRRTSQDSDNEDDGYDIQDEVPEYVMRIPTKRGEDQRKKPQRGEQKEAVIKENDGAGSESMKFISETNKLVQALMDQLAEMKRTDKAKHETQPRKQPTNDGIVCYGCRERGHMIRDCPEKKKMQSKKENHHGREAPVKRNREDNNLN